MVSLLLSTLVSQQPQFDRVLDSPLLKGGTAAVVLTDAKGNVLYERNGDVRLAPASNQKILSCAFAMAALGPEATLKTRIWKTSEGLIVEAEGDPSLTSAALKEAAKKLGVSGPTLVRVKQAFRVGPPPTWEWDDLPYRYAAPITALTVDRGGWELFADQGALVPPDPALGVRARHRRQTGEVAARFSPWTREADVDGVLPKTRGRIAAFALPEPDRAAAGFLGGRLAAFSYPLPSREPDLILASPPVRQLIKDCLEPSDNLFAEHLLLAAAAKMGPLGEDPYSVAGSRMRAFFVEKVGLTPQDLRPVDGSGLSRQNMVTARAVVRILRWADSQSWGRDFTVGLAAPGEGTLASRLQTVKFAGKTGTINAVSTLSGIIRPGEEGRLFISILFNGALATGRELRVLQDELVTLASAEDRHAHP